MYTGISHQELLEREGLATLQDIQDKPYEAAHLIFRLHLSLEMTEALFQRAKQCLITLKRMENLSGNK